MHVSIRSICSCIEANNLTHAHLGIAKFDVFKERWTFRRISCVSVVALYSDLSYVDSCMLIFI